MDEYVRYNGIPHQVLPRQQQQELKESKSVLEKQLELQQWILDPDSRPYDYDNDHREEVLNHVLQVLKKH